MKGFLIVLDSFGIDAASDAGAFGDQGANTLKTITAFPRFSYSKFNTAGPVEY